MGKSPAFTLNGHVITENKTGYTGDVVRLETGYVVKLSKGPDDQKKRFALEKRMRNWYYYSQVKDVNKPSV